GRMSLNIIHCPTFLKC
ncbi:TPR repeat family protein, partial [Vibrio parahaemolyticus V-223/04]